MKWSGAVGLVLTSSTNVINNIITESTFGTVSVLSVLRTVRTGFPAVLPPFYSDFHFHFHSHYALCPSRACVQKIYFLDARCGRRRACEARTILLNLRQDTLHSHCWLQKSQNKQNHYHHHISLFILQLKEKKRKRKY